MFRREKHKKNLNKLTGWAIPGILVLLLTASCEILDKEPLDAIPTSDIWNNEVLATAYLNDIYFITIFRKILGYFFSIAFIKVNFRFVLEIGRASCRERV